MTFCTGAQGGALYGIYCMTETTSYIDLWVWRIANAFGSITYIRVYVQEYIAAQSCRFVC